MAVTEIPTLPQVRDPSGFELVAEKLDRLVPDAYQPSQIISRLEDICTAKANQNVFSMVLLGLLAGFFIGLGALFFMVVTTNSGLGFGMTRLVGGLTFSLGLILVVVAGAELFTGNCLIVAPWLSNRVSGSALLRNWLIVYAANFAGAAILLVLLFHGRFWELDGYAVGANALMIANAKVNMAFLPALFKGIMCNVLVCLAVLLCLSARSTSGKIMAIVFPISAFVACGFEHSIANMFFIPLGMSLAGQSDVLQAAGVTAGQVANINSLGLLSNLVPVTIGNVIGGTSVAVVYWMIYQRKERLAEALIAKRWLGRLVRVSPQPSSTYAIDPETRALVSVLARARDDSSFLAQLAENPDHTLEGYNLTGEARAALASGDVNWLESRVGFLDEPLRTWLVSRLSQEKW
ncbi:MAG: formate/nitrite transporter family protein [Dehalococcoidia bacterium]